ncbi:hypothetical protein C942_01526 [Photobacterium marinum]|uniref:Uncharacterized protein n=1 Tax=Photobacterium marinum TaxID=1056511 RepID=L8JFF6_9GAMM|nr:hypothetical protein C942_01526 [Photobacterium marinum]
MRGYVYQLCWCLIAFKFTKIEVKAINIDGFVVDNSNLKGLYVVQLSV